MAANITLSAGSCDATGKVWTFPLLTGGVTGSGYAITNANGLLPHLSGSLTFPVASAAISGTNLVVTTTAAAGIVSAVAEVLKFDVATAAGGCTLTDGSGNTPTGQTNVSVTNNSTITVAIFNPITNYDKFEFGGQATQAATLDGLPQSRSYSWVDTSDPAVEWVTDATEVAWLGYSGSAPGMSVDGASVTPIGTGFWSIFNLTPTPLSAGKHLFQKLGGGGDYFTGIRLVGGTRSMFAVPTTKVTAFANTQTSPNVGQTTPVKVWGTYRTPDSSGTGATGYGGTILSFQINGTGVDVAGVDGLFATWAVSVDGGNEGQLVPGGDGTFTNANAWMPLVEAASGAAHTIRAHWLAVMNANFKGLRVINGTKTTASAAIGDGTLTVAATASLIAVNDWVRIDKYVSREFRQVTAISGTGPYTLTLNATLAKAHTSGATVTSYSAPAGTITAWSAPDAPTTGKLVVGMGDSNTHAENDYGFAGTPDANGTFYLQYDNRWSYGYLACKQIGHEWSNVGVQGTDTANQAARAADIVAYGRSAFDFCLIREGTNDINGSTMTAAAAQANIQTQIDTARSGLKAGGKFILLPCLTQQGHTNAQGLNIATFNAVQQAIVANATYSAVTVYASGLQNGFNLTDYNASTNPTGDLNVLHYHTPSGVQRSANNTIPYILATGYTASVTGAVMTITRGGGSTFSNSAAGSDAITHTAGAGTLTVTGAGAGATITGNGTGTVTVKPADGVTSYTVTASASNTTVNTNAQGWTDPSSASFTASSTTGNFHMTDPIVSSMYCDLNTPRKAQPSF